MAPPQEHPFRQHSTRQPWRNLLSYPSPSHFLCPFPLFKGVRRWVWEHFRHIHHHVLNFVPLTALFLSQRISMAHFVSPRVPLESDVSAPPFITACSNELIPFTWITDLVTVKLFCKLNIKEVWSPGCQKKKNHWKRPWAVFDRFLFLFYIEHFVRRLDMKITSMKLSIGPTDVRSLKKSFYWFLWWFACM